MPDEIALHTDRLLLTPWRPEDRAPFAALNADPRVMGRFLAPLNTTVICRLFDTAACST
jgi:RimJ/RimL family protein N-acetyltransferase